MIYSHSRIECFEECPRKFRHRYIDKIKVEDFDTIEKYMGQKVHQTLEHLYLKAMEENAPELDEVIIHYNTIWEREIGGHIQVVSEKSTQNDYKILGEKRVRDYYNTHAPFDKVNTVATELLVRTDLKNDGNYKLIGYIDRVDRLDGGIYEIHDYKTSSKLMSQNKADTDRQLTIYEMGLRNVYNDISEVRYIWHYLAHGKKITSKSDGIRLQEQKKSIIESIHRIEEAIVEEWYPMVKTPKCRWCEYQTICKEKDGEKDTKQGRIGDYIEIK